MNRAFIYYIIYQACKSPLVVLWTFRVNKDNLNAIREQRRQIEIEDAKKRQLEIALKKANRNREGKQNIFEKNLKI